MRIFLKIWLIAVTYPKRSTALSFVIWWLFLHRSWVLTRKTLMLPFHQCGVKALKSLSSLPVNSYLAQDISMVGSRSMLETLESQSRKSSNISFLEVWTKDNLLCHSIGSSGAPPFLCSLKVAFHSRDHSQISFMRPWATERRSGLNLHGVKFPGKSWNSPATTVRLLEVSPFCSLAVCLWHDFPHQHSGFVVHHYITVPL